MEVKGKMWEAAVPFVLMVLMEGCTIALTITVNSAMEDGMNQFVFVAYSNALSSSILLPYSLFFHRHRIKEIFDFKLLTRFFFLGLTGISIGQNLAFTGMRYSSPIVVCGMGLLLPSFQFILALILSRSIQIRIAGTLMSSMGAVVVAIYKGPSIIQTSIFHPLILHGQTPLLIFISTSQHWLLGSLLLACSTLSLAVWGILQVAAIKRFPDVMLIVTCYTIFGTLQTAVIDLIAERDLSAWKLKMNLELVVIIVAAIFGTVVRSWVQAWCMSLKGPMYVSMFRPIGIFWACAITLNLFGSSLHYGSVMGALIAGIGYYTVLWGITREEEERRLDKCGRSNCSSDINAQLLQEEDRV
ncbi:hypothetical protein Nepgr_003471 [Nepenthes gracilis]|uniref:WAT1-related protein n=1 Tax=Nepenthes gracilis TaxID=150966 RepID=A0AAD3XDP3_NEPGR|nr:hypothetical protein Nepgr_003471 [Nepenthes gracilis]